MQQPTRVAVVGGGAAGFFLALNLKEQCPQLQVDILERASRVLRKVVLAGGGRCNLTNTFDGIGDLQAVYPRGHRLMRRLFRQFDHNATWQWFEQRGVSLVAQADHCVFPRSQDSQTIVNLFLAEARRLGVSVRTGCSVDTLDDLADYDYACITTGGQPRRENLLWLGQEVVEPVPSLFTLSIADDSLRALAGTVVQQATVAVPATKMRATGALLVTHWGISGPAVLRLSSYAARLLAERDYRSPLVVNWLSSNADEALDTLQQLLRTGGQRLVTSIAPHGLPQRLWAYLAEKSLLQRAHAPWSSLNRKELLRLTNVLTADELQVSGRAPHRDEFVTAGGISLSAVSPQTLESKSRPRLFFAGEVLDIDGVTGGFNLQAAWTTAYVVATAIARESEGKTPL